MNKIDLVGMLFVIWGGVTVLIGASMLALGIGAVTLIEPASSDAGGERLAIVLFAGTLTTLAVIAIIWGIAHIAVGVPVQRRRHWSRLAALLLGAVDLLLLPYGTALGAFALWTLLRDDARTAFAPAQAS
jgi:hypothetical protein